MTLHVVTHARWVADDLAASGTPVRHHLGFDLPDFADGDSVWAPMEWMARAVAVEPRLHLADPGPDFTPNLDTRFTQRTIETLTFDDIVARDDALTAEHGRWHDGPDVFVKPANCKIEALPARFDDYQGHVLHLIAARLKSRDRQPLHVTSTRLDILEEHRLFILDGVVVTSSPYLHHHRDGSQTLWSADMRAHPDVAADAQAFGADVLASVDPSALPVSFTLDVAFLADLSWAVIETNPVWSSAFYGADVTRVADCIRAASLVSGPPFAHEWVPDPYVADRAARMRPLR